MFFPTISSRLQERALFSDAYRAMTDGFLAFPLLLPGTGVWKGRQGRYYIIKVRVHVSVCVGRGGDGVPGGQDDGYRQSATGAAP